MLRKNFFSINFLDAFKVSRKSVQLKAPRKCVPKFGTSDVQVKASKKSVQDAFNFESVVDLTNLGGHFFSLGI